MSGEQGAHISPRTLADLNAGDEVAVFAYTRYSEAMNIPWLSRVEKVSGNRTRLLHVDGQTFGADGVQINSNPVYAGQYPRHLQAVTPELLERIEHDESKRELVGLLKKLRPASLSSASRRTLIRALRALPELNPLNEGGAR